MTFGPHSPGLSKNITNNFYFDRPEVGFMTQDRFSSRRVCILSSLVIFLVTSGIQSQAVGALVIDLPDIAVLGSNVTATNGVYEVALNLTGADLASPPPVSSFNIDFLYNPIADGSSGLSFAAAQRATTSPLFGTNGFFGSFGTSTNVQAAGDVTPSSLPSFNGAGLLKVPFTIAAGNLGTTYHLNFGPLNEITYTNGSTVTSYPLTLIGGSILVTVPEAAAWKQFTAVVMLAGIGLAVVKVRRRVAVR